MKIPLTKFGAEPKKLAVLGGLLVVAGYFFFSRDTGEAPTAAKPSGTAASATNQRASLRSGNRLRPGERGLNAGPKEFRPSFKAKDIDPSGVDPTLHLDLLAKLQDVKVESSGRSLFELGAPPPTPSEIAKLKEPEKIKPSPVGPQLPPPPPPPPPEAKAPAIPLKFYGFVNQSKAGDKRAFFLDGEEIIIANEGDMIKKRYKIVRIGVSSAIVEDTQFKGANTQQTLPLEAELAG